MLKMAKQNDIQLIFVRTKRRRDIEPNSQPKALQKYIKNLEDYLAKNRIVFIDFTNDKRIKIEHYGSGDHLSRSGGKQLFTKILAEKMLPVIQNLDRWFFQLSLAKTGQSPILNARLFSLHSVFLLSLCR